MGTFQEFKNVLDELESQELSQIASQYINESAKAVNELIAKGKDQGLDLSSNDESIEYSEAELEAASQLLANYKGAENVYNTLIDKGSQKGIELTTDEVETYLQEMAASDEFKDIELGDEALAQVSGGAWFFGGLAAKAIMYVAKKVTAKKVVKFAAKSVIKSHIRKAANLPWYAP